MEIELHLRPYMAHEINCLLVAPVEVLAKVQSSRLELQRHMVFFFCDRGSSRLDRNLKVLEARRRGVKIIRKVQRKYGKNQI